MRILIAMALLCTPAYAAQDTFLGEDGSVIDVSTTSVPIRLPGLLEVEFSFQSNVQDVGTGLFAEPVYHTAYSVRPDFATESEMSLMERRWVFWKYPSPTKADTVSFDPVTGTGTATVRLPFNVQTSSAPNGQFYGGDNVVVLYWGMLGTVLDPVVPPTGHSGSKTVNVHTVVPDFGLFVDEGRALQTGDQVGVTVFVESTETFDRVFDLVPSSGAVMCPPQAVIPAHERSVDVALTAVAEGQATIGCSSSSFPGMNEESNLLIVKEARVSEAVSAPISAPSPLGGAGSRLIPGANEGEDPTDRKCRAPTATDPDGNSDNTTGTLLIFGDCIISAPGFPRIPQVSDCDDQEAAAWRIYYAPAKCIPRIERVCDFSIYQPESVNIGAWQRTDSYLLECATTEATVGWDWWVLEFGTSVSVPSYRMICEFTKTSDHFEWFSMCADEVAP